MATPVEDEIAQRLFVAVRPPPSVVCSLSALPRAETPGVRWVDPAHWHLTVRFLPRADPTQVTAALDRADLTKTQVTLGPAVISFGGRVVVIPAVGLEDLAGAVLEATQDLAPIDPRPFNGHLTMARTKTDAECGLVGQPFAASFEAHEIELVASDTGRNGPHHRILKNWPLAQPDA